MFTSEHLVFESLAAFSSLKCRHIPQNPLIPSHIMSAPITPHLNDKEHTNGDDCGQNVVVIVAEPLNMVLYRYYGRARLKGWMYRKDPMSNERPLRRKR
jgi:hypothetical protein